jgi:hypothetical protein
MPFRSERTKVRKVSQELLRVRRALNFWELACAKNTHQNYPMNIGYCCVSTDDQKPRGVAQRQRGPSRYARRLWCL